MTIRGQCVEPIRRPVKRYGIDVLAAGLRDCVVAAILEARMRITKPVQSVVLWRDSSETFVAQTALVNMYPGAPMGYARADLALDLLVPTSGVPTSLHSVERYGDPIRAAFLRRHRVGRTSDWWSEVICVPRILVHIEVGRAFGALAPELIDAGVRIGARFAVYDGDPDETFPIRTKATLDAAVRRDLRVKFKSVAALRSFAELCYDDPARQRWLTKLGQG